MKKHVFFPLFVAYSVTAVILISCKKTEEPVLPGDPVDIPIETYQREVIDSANRFAFELFKPCLHESKGSGNILISPFSVTSALSMTLNGASGDTYEAMRMSLGLDSKTIEQINSTYLKLMTEMVNVDNRVILEIANSVWVEKRLEVKQQFISDLATWYKADAKEIDVTDPGAVTTVNNWIAEKTHDRIKDMLDQLDPDLAMLLINAIYFNGKWKYAFDKADTKEEPFYVSPSSPESVSMMHLAAAMPAIRSDNLTIAEIPYGQGNFNMVVVLPDEGTSIEELADKLSPTLWQQWMALLTNNSHNINLSMPRFQYKYKRLMNDDLISLGMGIAFSNDADFNNISNQGLKITRVLHQAFIENNEEGTEAAAATVVEIVFTSAGPGQEVFNVTLDHPFLFFIRESATGTILFMGKVGDPNLN